MTIQTLRPSSLAIASDSYVVADTGGGGTTDPTVAVSDNFDVTSVRGTVDKMYMRWTLTNLTALPANQRVRSVQVRLRTAPDSGNTITTQDTLTRVNDCVASHLGTCIGVGRLLLQRGVQGISSNTGPLAYVGPCNEAWTDVLVNNLCVETTWYRPAIGNWVFQHVIGIYIDVDVATQPTVATPIVTNFTDNAKPSIAWTYNSVDHYPQVAYRARIFDAATYGAANFDAKTTRATWDSGIVYSTASSVKVPISLLNGVTYRAYMQVAMAWPGPQGSIWWSNPVNSASFTVTFVPPAAPAIQSAAVLADPNQYRAALSILVPVNLLSIDNASFEASLGQWAALTNCTVQRDTAQHADGIASMRMTATAAGAMFAQCAVDPSGDPRVDPGKTYTVLASFRAATTGRPCLVGVQWQDGSGANIGGITYGGSVTDSTANFNAQAAVITTTPSNAYQGKVTVQVQGAAAGEIHYVDKVDIHVGSSITWTPGGYVNDQGDLLVERGEYLDDERGPVDNWFHPQVGSCGTFLRSPGYGFLTSDSRLQWRWLDQVIPWEGETPSGMLDWYPSVQSVPYIRFGDWTYGGTAFMAPAIANQPHTFSVWAWCSVNTVTAQPRIDWRDQSGNITATAVGPNTVLTTTPQRLQITGTAPVGVVLATGAVVLPNSDQTQHLFFTRAGYGIGTLPVDGKMPKGIATGFLPNGLPLGVDWTPVRWRDTGELMSTQAFPGNPPGFNTGQVETIVDHEYPPGRPVLYRASITYSATGAPVRSPYSNVAVVYGQPPASTLLRSVTNPMLGVAVNRLKLTTVAGGFIGTHPHSITDDAAVFHPLGADAAPVRIRDWVGGDDGQLIAVTVSDAQAHRLMAVISANDVFQIQWAQGGRTYCLITDRNYTEMLSSDSDYHDIEGQILGYLRHLQFTLAYVETVAP